MATTPQKKKPTASGGRRSSASSGTRSASSSRRGAPQPRPIRREVGAVVCLFLAIFAALGYFGLEGIFINLLSNALKGLIGYGYWLMPPMLLVGAYILAFHRGRPVRLRLFCALVFPLLMGAMLHLFLTKTPYPWAWAMVKSLWADGLALHCGGVLGGLLCLSFSAVFSSVGAGIVLVILALLCLLGAFNRTIVQLVEQFRGRERREYEYEEPEPPKPVKEKPAPRPACANIDIPLDDTPRIHVELEEQPKKKKGFFSKDRAVPTPGEFLTGAASKPAEKPAEAETKPRSDLEYPEPQPYFTVPSPGPYPGYNPPVEDAEETPIPPAPVKPDPAVAKVTKEEAAQATAEVTAQIDETMGQAAPMAYQYPPVSLLTQGDAATGEQALGELKRNQDRLAETIRSFGVEANIVNVVRGPSVTRYEMELDQGVKLSRVTDRKSVV